MCVLLIIVLAAVPLAGYLTSEGNAFSMQEGKGIIGGVIAQLHREDQEDDAAEDHEPAAQILEMSKDERREMHEEREAAEAARGGEAAAEPPFVEPEQG